MRRRDRKKSLRETRPRKRKGKKRLNEYDQIPHEMDSHITHALEDLNFMTDVTAEGVVFQTPKRGDVIIGGEIFYGNGELQLHIVWTEESKRPVFLDEYSVNVLRQLRSDDIRDIVPIIQDEIGIWMEKIQNKANHLSMVMDLHY